MKILINVFFDALIWGVLLGYPFTALYSSAGFWCAIAALCCIIFVGTKISEWFKNTAGKIFGGLLIVLPLLIFCFAIISEPARDEALTLIGMGGYLNDFANYDIPFWKLVVGAALNFILFRVIESTTKDDQKS